MVRDLGCSNIHHANRQSRSPSYRFKLAGTESQPVALQQPIVPQPAAPAEATASVEADQRLQALQDELAHARIAAEESLRLERERYQALEQAKAAEIQLLQELLNKARLQLHEEQQARTIQVQGLQLQLNHEQHARIAAEESLRSERAQGTSRRLLYRYLVRSPLKPR